MTDSGRHGNGLVGVLAQYLAVGDASASSEDVECLLAVGEISKYSSCT